MMRFKAAPYFTMFPAAFAQRALEEARPGDWVLDPFSGRGTTLYVARSLRLNASGIDVSPVAVAYSRAQLAEASLEEVLALLDELLDRPVPNWDPGDLKAFWSLAYHPETLADLLRVREGLFTEKGDAADLLRLFILARLHGPMNHTRTYLSNQMPRTYAPKPEYAVRFWQSRNLRPPRVDLRRVVRRVAERYLKETLPKVDGRVALGDARTIDYASLGGPYRFVVTSPPYPGMRTYLPDQWLRNWFVGGPPRVAYVYEGQLSSAGGQTLVDGMRAVWLKAASASSEGAKLMVRLGNLPRSTARKYDPRELFLASIEGTPWRLLQAERVPGRAGRQSRQFRRGGTTQGDEYDFMAILG